MNRTLKQALTMVLSVMMVLTSMAPSFAYSSSEVGSAEMGVEQAAEQNAVLTVDAKDEHGYYVLNLLSGTPNEDVLENAAWGQSITEKGQKEFGEPESLYATLLSILENEKSAELLEAFLSENKDYISQDICLAPKEGETDKYDVMPGMYLILSDEDYYEPQIVTVNDNDLKVELVKSPKKEAKEEEKAEAAEPKEEKAETSEVAKAETNEVSDEAVEAE